MSWLGFQFASKITTRFAATRFVPREPARVEMRSSRSWGLPGSLKRCWISYRFSALTLPQMMSKSCAAVQPHFLADRRLLCPSENHEGAIVSSIRLMSLSVSSDRVNRSLEGS